jgi:phosphoribosyl-AMP cyclohydrolase
MTTRDKKKIEEGTEAMIDFGKLKEVCDKIIIKGGENVIPVVVQDAETLEVLILAYANKQALDYSLKNRVATFWSTSRNELWVKGKDSGCQLELIEVRVNCDQNSLLYLVRPVDGACHTKTEQGKFRLSCYYRKFSATSDGLTFLDQRRRRARNGS